MSDILERSRLDERVVVVTGASSGLGTAVAVAAAQAGANLVLGARRVELHQTAAAVEAVCRKAPVVPTDVTQVEDCRHLVHQAIDAFGRVDGLVNSAGIASAVPALRESPDDFRAVLDLNLMGTYWMAQAAAEAMTAGGSIVNVSSVLGFAGADLPQAAYASSKAGVLGLTRDLAVRWSGRRSIRVNALAPGFFESEMTDLCRPGYLEALTSRTPLGRIGSPDEIADAVIFLLSGASSFMTGATLVVDGGLTIA